MMTKRITTAFVLTASFTILLLPDAMAQDVLALGNGEKCTSVVVGSSNAAVPVFIRDLSGSPLGAEHPVFEKIHGFSLTIAPSPRDSVRRDSGGRLLLGAAAAGVTLRLTPLTEGRSATADSFSYFVVYDERSNPLPLRLNVPPPGDLVAEISVSLRSDLPVGSRVDLRLLPEMKTTQLVHRAGIKFESVPEGSLRLGNGCIEITEKR